MVTAGSAEPESSKITAMLSPYVPADQLAVTVSHALSMPSPSQTSESKVPVPETIRVTLVAPTFSVALG